MTSFLVLYKAETSAMEQMSNATPEQAQSGMQAWTAWFEKAGPAIVDGGSPVTGDDATVAGYSVLQADSREALDELLAEHPHRRVGTVEVYEALPMPGM